MQKRRQHIIHFVIIILVFFVGYFVARQFRSWAREEYMSVTDLPTWISLEMSRKGKIMTDTAHGYRLTLGKGTDVSYFRDQILIGGSLPSGALPDMTFTFHQNTAGHDIHSWLENEHEKYGYVYYEDRVQVLIDGRETIMIREEGMGDVYSFFVAINNSVLEITTQDKNTYQSMIQSIDFIE